MTATTERTNFVPPPTGEENADPHRKWRWAFMIAGGIFIVVTLAIRIVVPVFTDSNAPDLSGPALAPGPVTGDAAAHTDTGIAPNAPDTALEATARQPDAPPAVPDASSPVAAAPAANTAPAPPAAARTAPGTQADQTGQDQTGQDGQAAVPELDISDMLGNDPTQPYDEKSGERALAAITGLGKPETATEPEVVPTTAQLGAQVAVGAGQHLNVRDRPGVSGSAIVGSLADGSAITLSGWATASDGSVWVQLRDPDSPTIDQGWLYGPLVALDDPARAFTDLDEVELP